LSIDNSGFIFIEIMISLILLFILLTIFAFTNLTLVRLLEEAELNKLFYLNSLNIGNELVIYLLEPTSAFFTIDKNYSIDEIEDKYLEFNSCIDKRIREEMKINISRKYSINSYILYVLNINYNNNQIVYLFFR